MHIHSKFFHIWWWDKCRWICVRPPCFYEENRVVYSSQNLIINSVCFPLLYLIDVNSSLDIVASAELLHLPLSASCFCFTRECPSSSFFFFFCMHTTVFLKICFSEMWWVLTGSVKYRIWSVLPSCFSPVYLLSFLFGQQIKEYIS